MNNKYYSFNYTTVDNALNSTFMNRQENPNGTTVLNHQVIQAPSHFIYEEIVKTQPATTQQSITTVH